MDFLKKKINDWSTADLRRFIIRTVANEAPYPKNQVLDSLEVDNLLITGSSQIAIPTGTHVGNFAQGTPGAIKLLQFGTDDFVQLAWDTGKARWISDASICNAKAVEDPPWFTLSTTEVAVEYQTPTLFPWRDAVDAGMKLQLRFIVSIVNNTAGRTTTFTPIYQPGNVDATPDAGTLDTGHTLTQTGTTLVRKDTGWYDVVAGGGLGMTLRDYMYAGFTLKTSNAADPAIMTAGTGFFRYIQDI